MATWLRLAVLTGIVVSFGAVWEVDANLQQKIIGGQPVCDGYMAQDSITCYHPKIKDCARVRGYYIQWGVLYTYNIYNNSDTRCSSVEYKNQRTQQVDVCSGGYGGWVEHGTYDCIPDHIFDWL
jgi:hypothetical protein